MATATRRPVAQSIGALGPFAGWGAFLAAVAVLLWLGVSSGVCADRLSTWVRLGTTGLTLGALYAMIALGYTMVYGVLQLLNFAHSEVFMIGTFGGLYAVTEVFGISDAKYPGGLGGAHLVLVLVGAIALAGLAAGLTAVIIERFAYRPLRKGGASRLGYLITAIGVSLFLSNLFLLLDGQRHLGLPFTWPHIGGREPVLFPDYMHRSDVFTLFGVRVTNLEVLVVAVAIVMLVVLDLFVRRTRAGKGIRAVAEDPETAALMGVDINRIVVMTFFVGGVMAGAAGLLYGTFFGQTQWNLGFIPGIKAFTAAVLGGIGNVRGAMLGGVLLGLIENVGVACTGTQWQAVIAFVVLVGVLMFRPTGLLGEQVGG
jgi:branched-chain amino acid transport system permease protein